MSRSKSHHANNAQKKISNSVPTPLKINKISHSIKKSFSSPSQPPFPTNQQRHPVIIYTHSPVVIHTKPKDFMALVQKLTGQSSPRSEDENDDQNPKTDDSNPDSDSKNKTLKAVRVDSEALSSEEDDKRVIWRSNKNNNSSCNFGPQKQIFGLRSPDFFCPNLPFYGYGDPFLFGGF